MRIESRSTAVAGVYAMTTSWWGSVGSSASPLGPLGTANWVPGDGIFLLMEGVPEWPSLAPRDATARGLEPTVENCPRPRPGPRPDRRLRESDVAQSSPEPIPADAGGRCHCRLSRASAEPAVTTWRHLVRLTKRRVG